VLLDQSQQMVVGNLAFQTPNAAGVVGRNPDVAPNLQSVIQLPQPEETGWKDTLKMYPGTVTRLAVRYAPQAKAVGTTGAGTNDFAFDPSTGPDTWSIATSSTTKTTR
jgi:hypothetical protein